MERDAPATLRWRILALVMAYAFMCHFNRVSMSVAGTERLMAEFGISETRMGMVYSAYLIVYTLCMTPGGWIIDRFGPKLALVAMGFGSATFVALTGSVGLVASAAFAWPAFMVLRGSAGFFSAPIHPSGARIVSHWFPRNMQAMGNGLITAAALVGISSTFYVFGAVMDRCGWPASFAIAGTVTAVVAIAWTVLGSDRLQSTRSPTSSAMSSIVHSSGFGRSPPDAAGKPQAQRGPDRFETPAAAATTSPESKQWYSLLRDRSLVLLTISYAAVGYFEYLFFYWMQYYFDKVLELGTDRSRAYSTIATLAMAVGMYAGGHIADEIGLRFGLRAGRAAVPVCGMLLSAVLLIAGIYTRQPIAVLVCFSAALACVGASEGPFWTTAVDLGRTRGGTSAAILNTGGNAGGLLAPILTPLFSTHFGWQSGLALASLFAILGALLWIWIQPNENDRQ